MFDLILFVFFQICMMWAMCSNIHTSMFNHTKIQAFRDRFCKDYVVIGVVLFPTGFWCSWCSFSLFAPSFFGAPLPYSLLVALHPCKLLVLLVLVLHAPFSYSLLVFLFLVCFWCSQCPFLMFFFPNPSLVLHGVPIY